MPPEEAPAYITDLPPWKSPFLQIFVGWTKKGRKQRLLTQKSLSNSSERGGTLVQIILTMTPQGAAEYLRASGMSISPDTLRRGIEQGVYPFGLCIKTDGSAVYQIFKRLLDEWIAERSVEEVP